MAVVKKTKIMTADQRLRNLFSHLSPPVTAAESESPPAELGRRGGHLALECEGPNSEREGKLLENLVLSRLRRFEKRDDADEGEIRFVLCRGELKSQGMAEEEPAVNLETRDLENTDSETEDSRLSEGHAACGAVCDGERGEQVRSGVIASASAVATSGAGEGQLNGKVERKTKAVRYLRSAACKFCDVIQGTAPCFKLYEDELCLCILDVNPLCVGHSLILPKSHFPCLEATPPQVAAAMCAAVPLISKALLAATRCDSFNMLVNNGIAAGQVIMHTHFHIIPRCKGDGLWKSEGAKRRPLQKLQEAKLLAHTVRANLLFTDGSTTQ